MPAPLHPTALRPWQPLRDAEWEAIRGYLPDPRRGGATATRRKTLDAIFWIAASKEPWRALPSHLGKPDSVARTLRRWARAGVLERLLLAVSNHPLSTDNPHLRRLAWLIARAFRRMARILPVEAVMTARDLRMLDALPAPPFAIPNVRIFFPAQAVLARLCGRLRGGGREMVEALAPGLRAATAVMGLGAGRPRLWRLR